MRGRVLATAVCVVSLRAPIVRAQAAAGARAAVSVRSFDAERPSMPGRADPSFTGGEDSLAARGTAAASIERFVRPRSPRLQNAAPLVSAIIPGGGQLLLGDNRFVAYAAIEILGWFDYAKNRREQSQDEAAFRGLARRVARANFSPAPPDGNWTYYEAMRDWLESGSYSLAATGPVVPETDRGTFNGNQWQIALSTNPDTASALAQYERTAYKPEFQWSWKNAQLQYDIFKRTTFKRDDAHYAAVQSLIVIGANHFLSMADAFATLRLTVRPGAAGGRLVGASLRW